MESQLTLTDELSIDRSAEPRHRPRVLFVDDEPRVLKMISRTQANSNWELHFAEGGAQGLDVLASEDIDVVVSDMKMPEMGGVEFLSRVAKEHPHVVCVLMTGYSDLDETIEAINKGRIYSYIAKGGSDFDFKMAIFKALQYRRGQDEMRYLQATLAERNEELKQINDKLSEVVESRTQALQDTLDNVNRRQEELQQVYRTSVKLFSNLIELRSSRRGHGNRVARLAERLADKIAIDPKDREQISVAATLHDIGKVCFTDRELSVPYERLSDEEKFEFRNHAAMGSALIMSLKPYRQAAKMIRHHHESFDGGGYPDGLKGSEIPLGARVICICSDFDDLVNGWSPMPGEDALDIIRSSTGTRYDPNLVSRFELALREMAEIDPATVVEQSISEAESGAVLARDLLTRDGIALLSKGEILDAPMVERLRQFEEESGEQLHLQVYRTYGS